MNLLGYSAICTLEPLTELSNRIASDIYMKENCELLTQRDMLCIPVAHLM